MGRHPCVEHGCRFFGFSGLRAYGPRSSYEWRRCPLVAAAKSRWRGRGGMRAGNFVAPEEYQACRGMLLPVRTGTCRVPSILLLGMARPQTKPRVRDSTNDEGSQKAAPAGEDLPRLRSPLHVAEEVGKGVERGAPLQRPLPRGQIEEIPALRARRLTPFPPLEPRRPAPGQPGEPGRARSAGRSGSAAARSRRGPR